MILYSTMGFGPSEDTSDANGQIISGVVWIISDLDQVKPARHLDVCSSGPGTYRYLQMA